MTPQEQQLLDGFLQRLASAQGIEKDPEADALIRERVASNPDAAYLLVQRTLLLEQALENAQQQITQLQSAQAAPRPASASSFLSGGLSTGFGRSAGTVGNPGNPGNERAAPPPLPGEAQAGRQPQGLRERLFGGGNAGPAANAAPGAAAAPAGRGGSFLGSAAAAAAGVAGGMFLYSGLSNMMGGDKGATETANADTGAAAAAPAEQVAQNDVPADHGGAEAHDASWSDVDDGGGDFMDDDSFI